VLATAAEAKQDGRVQMRRDMLTFVVIRTAAACGCALLCQAGTDPGWDHP